MGHVGNTSDKAPTGRKMATETLQESVRLLEVLEHVTEKDDIEPLAFQVLFKAFGLHVRDDEPLAEPPCRFGEGCILLYRGHFAPLA